MKHRPQRYGNAPITEAIIDIAVTPRAGLTLDMLEQMHAGEMAAYPAKKNRGIAEGRLELGERVAATAVQHQTGFAFLSADQKRIFQARLGGFTFSQLAPYQGWEALCTEARRLWAVYRALTQPADILRVAVRYINRLDLP